VQAYADVQTKVNLVDVSAKAASVAPRLSNIEIFQQIDLVVKAVVWG